MFRVSRVLAAAGLVDTYWFTEAGRDRGTAVHAIAEAVLHGQAVSVAPAFEGYRHALESGFAALHFTPVVVERRLSDGDLNGRPDAIGVVGKRLGHIHAGPAIVDVKSGDPNPAHGVQLALYEMLAEANHVFDLLPGITGILPWSRIGLYVTDAGRYRIQPYTDQSDFTIAHAALDLMRWRLAHKLITHEPEQPDDPAFAGLEEVG